MSSASRAGPISDRVVKPVALQHLYIISTNHNTDNSIDYS